MTDKNLPANRQGSSSMVEYSPDEIRTIEGTLGFNPTPAELKLLVFHSKRTGLDLLAGQLIGVRRSGKMTIQTGIDGLRVIAQRSTQYDGQDPPVYYDENGNEYAAWLKSTPPIAAKVCVYRKDFSRPTCEVALWAEYYPKSGDYTGLWDKYSTVMLAKCAEARALRKAFPNDIGRIYANEEMQKADRLEEVRVDDRKETLHEERRRFDRVATDGNATASGEVQQADENPNRIILTAKGIDKQRSQFWGIYFKKLGITKEQHKDVCEFLGVSSMKDILETKELMEDALNKLRGFGKEEVEPEPEENTGPGEYEAEEVPENAEPADPENTKPAEAEGWKKNEETPETEPEPEPKEMPEIDGKTFNDYANILVNLIPPKANHVTEKGHEPVLYVTDGWKIIKDESRSFKDRLHDLAAILIEIDKYNEIPKKILQAIGEG